MTRQGSPILYFSYEFIIGPRLNMMHEENAHAMAEAWGRHAENCTVRIGGLEVGTVKEVICDRINLRIGFVIEWSDKIKVARRI